MQEPVGGARRGGGVGAVAMHEHERDRALGKQPDFAGQLGRPTDAGFCQPVGKLGLEHGFVPARNQARRVAGKISELHHQAREARQRGLSAHTASSLKRPSIMASTEPARRSPNVLEASTANRY
jgi:hypothetical protein